MLFVKLGQLLTMGLERMLSKAADPDEQDTESYQERISRLPGNSSRDLYKVFRKIRGLTRP